MKWTCLGHASWLVEVEELRLLFDPLVPNVHHGGIFEVFPPRTVDAAALRPDFVFVSHRHPDHFDLPSLRQLASLDADAVVVTPDPLVATCARRIGFRTVREIGAGTRIELDGARLVTTPSVSSSDPEWGVVVASTEGVAFNQVDTSLGPPAAVSSVLAAVAQALERPAEGLLSLAFVRWQPLLEIEAVTAGSIGFPFAAYQEELARAAALSARALVPSASGARHAAPFGAMNQLVYPVEPERFLADAQAMMPRTRVLPCVTGATYAIAAGDVSMDPRAGILAGLLEVPEVPEDPRDFRPVEIPPLVDPNLDGRSEPAMRRAIEAWVTRVLAPATSGYGDLVLLLEVIAPSRVDTYRLAGGRVTKGGDRRWDVRCAVAASMLDDVIASRRHWGDALLGGMLRACSRAYAVDEGGLRELPVQPFFVYAAISYEQSVIRALEHALSSRS